jgi:hypothetical protein
MWYCFQSHKADLDFLQHLVLARTIVAILERVDATHTLSGSAVKPTFSVRVMSTMTTSASCDGEVSIVRMSISFASGC